MQQWRPWAEAMAAPWHEVPLDGRLDRAALPPHLEARLALFDPRLNPRDLLAATWPGGGGCLLAATVAHAEALLVPYGDHWRLRPHCPPAELLRWRALTQRLPAGMWVAAAADGHPPPREVRLLTPDLAPTARTAHLHLHSSAVYPFEAVWTALMIREPPDFADGAGLSDTDAWRARLALLRMLRVALFRALRDEQTLGAALDSLPITRVPDDLRCAITRLLHEQPILSDKLTRRQIVRTARAVLGALSDRARSDWKPSTLDALWRADPLSRSVLRRWPEGHLLALGFQRLADQSDSPLRRAFLAYLRARNRLYAHLVTDPARPGLTRFAADFQRVDPYTVGLDRLIPSVAVRSHALDLGAIELRTTPRTASRWLRRDALGPDEGGVERGVIAHFVRHKDDPTPARRIRRLLTEGRRLARLLSAAPRAADTLRAIDIAGDERAGMAWQALPALRAVRQIGFDNARRHGTPPIRVTLHAGEEFSHLLSGLRAIDQPLRWGLLHRGDRLGHALALGLETQTAPTGPPARLVRALDLAWTLDRLATDARADGRWHARANDELHALLIDLLGLRLDPQAWRTLLPRTLGSARWLAARSVQSPGEAVAVGDVGERFLAAWLHGVPEATTRASQPVEGDTEPALMEHLQSCVAAELARAGVFVELNPSSNLTVGGRARLIDQPLFHLLPWQQTAGRVSPAITLSADDPLQFATCLADEYAYAWAALVDSGVSPDAASDWLEQIARNGWRGRFTSSTSHSHSGLLQT